MSALARTGRPGFVGRFLRSPAAVIGLVLLGVVAVMGVFATTIAPGPAYEIGSPYVAPPSRAHLLGTDFFARDMLFLTTRGVRTTLLIIMVVMLVTLPLGTSLGLAAGYAGGVVDSLITRCAEFVQAVPRFFLALAAIAVLGPGIDKLIVILCLTSWPFLCRALRAETLSLRERPYVAAAQAAGAGPVRVISRHVVPNVMPRAVVVLMLMGSRLILIEAGLAFLGLGDRGKPSLGVLLVEAQPHLREAWWLSVFPGVVLVVLVLGLNLLSDGLSRAFEVETEAGAAFGRRLSRRPA